MKTELDIRKSDREYTLTLVLDDTGVPVRCSWAIWNMRAYFPVALAMDVHAATGKLVRLVDQQDQGNGHGYADLSAAVVPPGRSWTADLSTVAAALVASYDFQLLGMDARRPLGSRSEVAHDVLARLGLDGDYDDSPEGKALLDYAGVLWSFFPEVLSLSRLSLALPTP